MQPVQLVRGRWIVCDASRRDGVLTDAAIAIVGDKICEIGPWNALSARFPDADLIGGPGHAVLPGFVNAHHHSYGLTHAQLGVPDGPLEAWLIDNGRTASFDPYHATLHSAAQLLRTGVTTVIDVDGGRGSPERLKRYWKSKLDAYRASGLRAVLAIGTSLHSVLVHGEGQDARFLAGLKGPALDAALRAKAQADDLSSDDYLRLVVELAEEVADDDHVAVAFGPPMLGSLDDAMLRRMAHLAETRDLAIHTHANESLYEGLDSLKHRNQTLAERLRDVGLANPRLTLAHGVWLTPSDIQGLARTGVSVVHNPSSNLRLRAGLAPVQALRTAGVRVGLGMDGTTLGDDEDMFTEMRLAWRLHQSPMIDGPALSPNDALSMATVEGAAIAGKSGVSGTLAPGVKADLTLVDLSRVGKPWIAPNVDPIDLIVRRARADDVDTVMVGGRIVYQGGAATGFDADVSAHALAEQAAAHASQHQTDPGLTALREAIVDWYAAWPTTPAQPFVSSAWTAARVSGFAAAAE